MPIGANTQLPFPANGVIYVEDAPSPDPMAAQGEVLVPTGHRRARGPKQPLRCLRRQCTEGCRGDIIVQGQLYGHLTLAANNNVIADGDLTYCLDPNTRLGVNTPTCVAPTMWRWHYRTEHAGQPRPP